MSDASPGTVARREDFDEAESTFRALSRSLRRADGFTLLVAVCNTPVRQKQLLERLDAELSESTLQIEIEADTDDVLALVEARLNDAPVTAVMITGLASGIRSEDPIHVKLRALNHRREEWRERVPLPIVLWIPEYLLQPLSQQAPDFLDWRSGTFLFLDSLRHSQISTSRTTDLASETWRLTETERRQRMSQLREWLTPESRLEPSSPARIRWLLELAEHHQRLGELDECLLIAQNEVLPVLAPKDEERRAFAWSLIADVLQYRGDLNEVLRIRRDEQLPIFERLEDAYSQAVTQGQIADVLLDRGRLDEALQIYRDVELPVFERLGHSREAAVTQGNIANILQSQGDLDEALRIRSELQLPVFQQLDDTLSVAVTRANIANIFQVRGDFEKAIDIYREDVLPTLERLGDLRNKAATYGKIANALHEQGEFDEALRIRHEEELPVYENLGDIRNKAVTLGRLADIYEAKGDVEEALRIRIEEQLPVYIQIGDARETLLTKGQIALLHAGRGKLKRAIRDLRELQSETEQLGDASLSLGFYENLAALYFKRDEGADFRRGREMLRKALDVAERMNLPRADDLRKLIRRIGKKN